LGHAAWVAHNLGECSLGESYFCDDLGAQCMESSVWGSTQMIGEHTVSGGVERRAQMWSTVGEHLPSKQMASFHHDRP